MKNISFLILATALILPLSAQAQTSDMVSVSAGLFDVGDDDEAGDFRLEYRWNDPVFWKISPWAGGEVTTDFSTWVGAGLLADFRVADQLIITPSVGAGLYDEGDSDLDLGFPLIFRTQIEAAYEFQNENRLSVAFSHLSNADLDDDNPGAEVLGIYWHIPTDQVFH